MKVRNCQYNSSPFRIFFSPFGFVAHLSGFCPHLLDFLLTFWIFFSPLSLKVVAAQGFFGPENKLLKQAIKTCLKQANKQVEIKAGFFSHLSDPRAFWDKVSPCGDD